MATLIFDLDDTLMDTTSWKADYFGVLSGILGVSSAAVEDAYKIFRSKSYFTPESFATYLSELYGISEHAILSALDTLSWDRYVSASMLEALRLLRREHSLLLFSKGAYDFQHQKIQRTGLGEFFDTTNSFITTDAKEKTFELLPVSEEKIYFINNLLEENNAVVARFPDVIPIHFTVNKKFETEGALRTSAQLLDILE